MHDQVGERDSSDARVPCPVEQGQVPMESNPPLKKRRPEDLRRLGLVVLPVYIFFARTPA